MLTFPAVCRLSKASVRLAMAGISCNGSHGRGTTRWNPESGSRNRVWKSHNDDSKWLKSLFHNISTQNRNLKYHFPISIFCGKLYPFAFLRLWIFLKMGKLKKHYIQTIKVLNSDFEWGLQTQFRGTQPFIERTQRSQRWFTMVDPPIKRDSNSVDDGELDAACPIS